MRKGIAIVGLAFIVLAVSVGVIFAQDTATTTAPWLGVHVHDVMGSVVVERVAAGSPAETAGVQPDDVIVSVNEADIADVAALNSAIAAAAVGDDVVLGIDRDGESLSLTATLAERPANVGMGGRGGRGLGMMEDGEFDPLTFAQRLLRAELTATETGYEVVNVLSINNPFAVEVGDVITEVNGLSVLDLDPAALMETMQSAETPALALTVVRAGETVTLEAAEGLGMRGGFGGHSGRGGEGFGGRGGRGGEGVGPQGGSNDAGTPPTVPNGQGGNV